MLNLPCSPFSDDSFRRRLAAFAVTALALAPVTARAHAVLLDSAPASGGHANSGHVTFRLRFNSRIDPARSRLTLTKPDHAKSVLPIESGTTPDTLQAAADLGPGAYGLRWQVLAIDGHLTRGDVGFTVTQSDGAAVSSAPAR